MVTHHLRFGTHAETKYFLNGFSDLYDEIVFNGNMVAYTQAAIAAFIISAGEKHFMIDPQTHAFQHDPTYLMSKNSKGVNAIKRSIRQLADRLGGPIAIAVDEGRAVEPSDFDDTSMSNLAQGTAIFQRSIVDEIKSHKDWEYLEYKLQEMGMQEPKPSGIIAPYFYMTDATLTKWLEINSKLIAKTREYCNDDELFAELVINRDVLVEDTSINQVIDTYKATDAGTILIWVDSLSEFEATKHELRQLRKLCEELTLSGKKVVNLFGGYFSVLLANKGLLHGVCNGLEYGESRAVVPVGGGIPMSKYYFTPLHFRMRYADLVTTYTRTGWAENPQDFAKNVCSCELCLDGNIEKYGEVNPVRVRRGANIITLNYPTPKAKDCSLRHYLYAKNVEFAAVESKSFEELVDELKKAKETYEPILGPNLVGHIDKWLEVTRD